MKYGALLLVCASVAIQGCASDIMKTYIGKPLSEVVMDYGPPNAAFDIDQRQRAFVWTRSYSYGLPGTATTTANTNMGLYTATTLINPPQTFSQECTYTAITEKIVGAPQGPASWRIVGFR